jgi:hypothetical protein
MERVGNSFNRLYSLASRDRTPLQIKVFLAFKCALKFFFTGVFNDHESQGWLFIADGPRACVDDHLDNIPGTGD